jgi:cytochrome c oxidase cbb3-type subunit 3
VTSQKETDAISGTETTGHEWDGIKELNTPLPRWWLWTFIVTIVWAVGYWIAMPAWPLVSDHTRGLLGYSSRVNVAESVTEGRAAQAQYLERIEALSLAEIRGDAELLDFAIAGGRSAFAVNCSQCHGLGAAGAVGYPNLNDDDWLWGGGLEEIAHTVNYGIRATHDETRVGDMPAFLRDEILSQEQAADVVDYVLSLSGGSEDAAAAARGAEVFAEECTACHQDGGVGSKELGAPSLANGIWLYGGDRKTIMESVGGGRAGVMPAWVGRLDGATVKLLTVYVHALGGGE